jgi:hypothetical protein
MRECSGIKANGERCHAQAMRSSQFCLNHDPDRVEENRRRASRGGRRGGRGRPSAELADIKRRLSDLADAVLEGEVDKGVGAVVSQILGTYVRTVSVELQVRDQLELVERMEAIEEALEQKEERRYGA